LSRSSSGDLGNFWVDFTRTLYRVMLPLCLGMALVYVWQGMPQTSLPRRWSPRWKARSSS